MSNIAYILTGKKPALADARYEQRIDQKSHVFEAGLHRTLGIVRRRFIPYHQARQFVAAVNTLERKMHLLSDDELKNNFNQISQNLCKFGLAETHAVAECFAVIREASKRVFKMRHHDVQIIGGWALLQGMIAEMATGEGKTLVATLPACAAVAAGAAVHVVTVNDYLAGRDAETMQPLYDFFGITVGVIREGMEPEERRVMYAKNVCYASNKELVFDYLKDQLAIGRQATDTHYRLKQLVSGSQAKPLLLRGLHMAIVDEVDSVLVDEARTPLIISATVPDDNGETLYKQALQLAGQLLQNQHFLITSEKEIDLLPAGLTHLAQLVRSGWRVGRFTLARTLCTTSLIGDSFI